MKAEWTNRDNLSIETTSQNSKAILVIEEMPAECIECQFCRVLADNKPTETHCLLTAKRNEDGVNTRAEWCPLRYLPKKKNTDFHPNIVYANGWNDCLNEIVGDKEWKALKD